MQVNEFKVRRVERYALTHYQSVDQMGASRLIGEYDNVGAAEEVGVALQALVPGSTLETVEGRQPMYAPAALRVAMAERVREQDAGGAPFAVVAVHTFDVNTKAYFAYSQEEAEQAKRQAEQDHGIEFRVYRR